MCIFAATIYRLSLLFRVLTIMNIRLLATTVALSGFTSIMAQEAVLLTGTALCDKTITNSDGTTSMDLTTASKAFDQKNNTYYRSSKADRGWVGLDLGTQHVITRIKWAPKTDLAVKYVHLGIFEGANSPDFMDAIPLYMVTPTENEGFETDIDIEVSRAFRYVRFIGPTGSYGQAAELEFYGYESEGSEDYFYQSTNLPLVVIHNEGGTDPKDKITNLPAITSVIYTSKKGNSKLVGGENTIRGRGNYSWSNSTMKKKPYRIKFTEKVEMPRGEKAKKWTLIPGYGDKTLMRIPLSFEVSRRFGMEYTPYCMPVEVMLNGEYKGVYQLCDQLEVGKHRINIDEMTAEDIDDVNITGGYFYEYDANGSRTSWADWQTKTEQERLSLDLGFTSTKSTKVSIKSPDEDVMQEVQFNYLKNYVNSVETAIWAKKANLGDYLDIDSFVKFFLVSEFVANTDEFWEMYQYKKRNDTRIYTGPVWDLDLTFDNDNRTTEYLNNLDATGWLYQSGGSVTGNLKTYVNYVLGNADVKQRMQEQWANVRASGLMSQESLYDQVDLMRDSLELAQDLNFRRWNILNTNIHQNYQSLGSWSEEIGTVENYIPKRLEWFDKTLSLTPDQYEINVSAAEWATIYLPMAFQVPEDLNVYIPTSVNDNSLLVLEPVDAAEANRPYLVHAPEGIYKLEGYSVNATDEQKLGLLIGTQNGTTVQAGNYVLQNHDGKISFYEVKEGEEPFLAAQRAYLELPQAQKGAPIRGFIVGEETSALQQIMINTDVVRIFNLSGQLILETAIVNGVFMEQDIFSNLNSGTYIIVNGNSSRKITIK